MTYKDDKDLPTGLTAESHDHDCGADCNCEHDEEECSTITLEMEDGTSKEFTILAMVEHKEQKYIALSEVGSMEYDILRMEYTEEQAELSEIEDDNEFEEVAAKFDAMFEEEDGEEDEEEEQ